MVKDSTHPNAGKLWVEHILSDDGALGYLEGGAIPARFAALVAAGKVTEDLKKNLPTADLIKKIRFPTQDQIDKAKQVLADNWGPMVAGELTGRPASPWRHRRSPSPVATSRPSWGTAPQRGPPAPAELGVGGPVALPRLPGAVPARPDGDVLSQALDRQRQPSISAP